MQPKPYHERNQALMVLSSSNRNYESNNLSIQSQMNSSASRLQSTQLWRQLVKGEEDLESNQAYRPTQLVPISQSSFLVPSTSQPKQTDIFDQVQQQQQPSTFSQIQQNNMAIQQAVINTRTQQQQVPQVAFDNNDLDLVAQMRKLQAENEQLNNFLQNYQKIQMLESSKDRELEKRLEQSEALLQMTKQKYEMVIQEQQKVITQQSHFIEQNKQQKQHIDNNVARVVQTSVSITPQIHAQQHAQTSNKQLKESCKRESPSMYSPRKVMTYCESKLASEVEFWKNKYNQLVGDKFLDLSAEKSEPQDKIMVAKADFLKMKEQMETLAKKALEQQSLIDKQTKMLEKTEIYANCVKSRKLKFIDCGQNFNPVHEMESVISQKDEYIVQLLRQIQILQTIVDDTESLSYKAKYQCTAAQLQQTNETVMRLSAQIVNLQGEIQQIKMIGEDKYKQLIASVVSSTSTQKDLLSVLKLDIELMKQQFFAIVDEENSKLVAKIQIIKAEAEKAVQTQVALALAAQQMQQQQLQQQLLDQQKIKEQDDAAQAVKQEFVSPVPQPQSTAVIPPPQTVIQQPQTSQAAAPPVQVAAQTLTVAPQVVEIKPVVAVPVVQPVVAKQEPPKSATPAPAAQGSRGIAAAIPVRGVPAASTRGSGPPAKALPAKGGRGMQ